MTDKILGYTLLSVGLLLMVLFSLNVYQVFTKQAQPISYFNLPSVTLNTGAFIPSQLQGQIQNPPTVEILSGQTLSDMANLTLHLVLMGFLVGVCYKIATLGVQLIKSSQIKPPLANQK